jgi:hypothetical protein
LKDLSISTHGIIADQEAPPTGASYIEVSISLLADLKPYADLSAVWYFDTCYCFYNELLMSFKDVQLTKDHIPVIYHDFLVGETGIDVPVHTMTLEQVK